METGSVVSSSRDYANKPRYANTHTRIGHTLAVTRRIARNSGRRPRVYIARANKIPAGNAAGIYGRVISSIVSRTCGVIRNCEKAWNKIKRIDCRSCRTKLLRGIDVAAFYNAFNVRSRWNRAEMRHFSSNIGLYACLSLNTRRFPCWWTSRERKVHSNLISRGKTKSIRKNGSGYLWKSQSLIQGQRAIMFDPSAFSLNADNAKNVSHGTLWACFPSAQDPIDRQRHPFLK